MMNNRSRFLGLIGHDRGLLALFGGIVVVAVIMLSLAITAGIWYL
jgi:hypothetical protein